MPYNQTILPLMREIRPMVLPHWGNAGSITAKSASPADLVTELDTAVEAFMTRKLLELYPDIGFVGEEFGGDREQSRFWLMDPIDGTAHFIRGLPFCTSMLALIEDGEVTFSVIYDFLNDQMYWAEKGLGAFCDDRRLHVSERELPDAYYSYEINLRKDENTALFARLFGKGLMVKTISAGWEFAMVADGKLDARICIDPYGKDYDFAPGTFLVKEAGGIVRNIGSETYDYRNLNFIAAAPKVYRDLVEGPFRPEDHDA
jgi:myo-inositol-1(or 4)-monophosphatase